MAIRGNLGPATMVWGVMTQDRTAEAVPVVGRVPARLVAMLAGDMGDPVALEVEGTEEAAEELAAGMQVAAEVGQAAVAEVATVPGQVAVGRHAVRQAMLPPSGLQGRPRRTSRQDY